MNDVELYGNLVRDFIKKMTSPEIGQFRLEVSTFRIILERARVQKPKLIKFTITDNGKVVNDMEDDLESLKAIEVLLQRSVEFISSLMGEELARDMIMKTMGSTVQEMCESLRGRQQLIQHIPEPLDLLVEEALSSVEITNDHEEVLGLFEDVFQAYLKELSNHTDLSAFKLKLSILREKHELLKHVSVTKNNTLDIDRDVWAAANDEQVKGSLVAAFNSMVGLSTFLVGKEEAIKKASRIFNYYFEGRSEVLRRYNMQDVILEGALHQKITTGFSPLDRKMGGGINKGSSILFISPSGIERDIFISNILTSGLNDGFSLLMVLSKEPPRSIRMLLRSQGLDANRFEEEGNLRIVDWFSWRGERIIGVEKEGYALKSSKILSNLGIAINKGLRELTFSPNKVALVHMIGPATNIFEFTQVYNFMQRLRAKFKEEEMASIFFLESETLSRESLTRIMEVFDGVVEMSKSLEAGKISREISVLTMSGVDFDASPIQFVIKDNRLSPLESLEKEERVKLDRVLAQDPPESSTPSDIDEIEDLEEFDEEEFEILEDVGGDDEGAPPQVDAGSGLLKEKPSAHGNDDEEWTDVKIRKDPMLASKIAKVIGKDGERGEKIFRKKLVRRKKGTVPPGKTVQISPERSGKKGHKVKMPRTPKEEKGSLKPKKVRKLITIHDRESRVVPSTDLGKLSKPEDILMEAIATIDDLLEGPDDSMSGARRKGTVQNKK
ncbi:MAG: RAD55 family ATPase [Thermoplasmatota archaeon]